MSQSMVTARMDSGKKTRGGRVLERDGLNASQAINLMYDRLIEEGDTGFLQNDTRREDHDAWQNAADFVDSLSRKRKSRFDNMSDAEIRMERLAQRGLRGE